eukprot:gene19733-biopygen2521
MGPLGSERGYTRRCGAHFKPFLAAFDTQNATKSVTNEPPDSSRGGLDPPPVDSSRGVPPRGVGPLPIGIIVYSLLEAGLPHGTFLGTRPALPPRAPCPLVGIDGSCSQHPEFSGGPPRAGARGQKEAWNSTPWGRRPN